MEPPVVAMHQAIRPELDRRYQLRARLLEAERRKQREQEAAQRKSLVGTGDRSERIRTYNFPQGRVTDHRINLTLYKLDQVMEGKLDELIDAGTLQDMTSDETKVEEELSKVPGVTVLIYDQTCAAEKRRRRKRGAFPDPAKRAEIYKQLNQKVYDLALYAILPVATTHRYEPLYLNGWYDGLDGINRNMMVDTQGTYVPGFSKK